MIKDLLKKFHNDRFGGVLEFLAVLSVVSFIILFTAPIFRDMMNTWINDTSEGSTSGVGQNFHKGSNEGDDIILINNPTPSDVVPTPSELYQRAISISPATKSEDMQVRIELTSANFDYSKIRNDGKDIRFTDYLDMPLPHWIESYNYGGTTVIWVKIPKKTTSQIKLLYGERLTTYQQLPKEVFPFFEDFNTSNTLNSNDWYSSTNLDYTISDGQLEIKKGGIATKEPFTDAFGNNYSVHAKISFNGVNTGTGHSGGAPFVSSDRFTCLHNGCSTATVLTMREKNSTSTSMWVGDGSQNSYNKGYFGNVWSASDYIWYNTTLSFGSGSVKFSVNGAEKLEVSNIGWAKPLKYIGLGAYGDGIEADIQNTKYDHVYVTKYSSETSTTSVGVELTRN